MSDNPDGMGARLKLVGQAWLLFSIPMAIAVIIGVASGWWLMAWYVGIILGVIGIVGTIAILVSDGGPQAGAIYRSSDWPQIDAMSGVEFERYVAAALRPLGFEVTFTAVTGDFGVDLVATRRGIRTAIQCKRQGRPVGSAAVQQVVAGAVMHDCLQVMVISNQPFTPAAHQLARRHRCKLIGRDKLMALEAAIGQR